MLEHSINSQKMNLEKASVWRATCTEFEWKMKGFGGQVVLENRNNSQKMDQEKASV